MFQTDYEYKNFINFDSKNGRKFVDKYADYTLHYKDDAVLCGMQ